MRKLSSIEENNYTVKLLDVITSEIDTKSDRPIDYIFLVMNFVDDKFKAILERDDQIDFTEKHLVIIMYNLLCSLNFMHSANVMHRDLKPDNILIDKECGTHICDFGLARTCLKPLYPDLSPYSKSSDRSKATLETPGSTVSEDNQVNLPNNKNTLEISSE